MSLLHTLTREELPGLRNLQDHAGEEGGTIQHSIEGKYFAGIHVEALPSNGRRGKYGEWKASSPRADRNGTQSNHGQSEPHLMIALPYN